MMFMPSSRIVSSLGGLFLCLNVAMTAKAEQASADKITMHSEVVDTPNDVFAFIDRINLQPNVSPFNDSVADVDITAIINLAQKTWDIIKANQPAATIKFNFANALPKGLTDSSSLTGFSNLQSKSVRMWGTNMWGATVYDITLTAVHQYGGQYEGKGQYLETVSVLPSHVSVLWGYTVNYTVETVNTTNGGTPDSPVAKMALHAKFKVETVMQKDETNTVFQFSGDSADVVSSGI